MTTLALFIFLCGTMFSSFAMESEQLCTRAIKKLNLLESAAKQGAVRSAVALLEFRRKLENPFYIITKTSATLLKDKEVCDAKGTIFPAIRESLRKSEKISFTRELEKREEQIIEGTLRILRQLKSQIVWHNDRKSAVALGDFIVNLKFRNYLMAPSSKKLLIKLLDDEGNVFPAIRESFEKIKDNRPYAQLD